MGENDSVQVEYISPSKYLLTFGYAACVLILISTLLFVIWYLYSGKGDAGAIIAASLIISSGIFVLAGKIFLESRIAISQSGFFYLDDVKREITPWESVSIDIKGDVVIIHGGSKRMRLNSFLYADQAKFWKIILKAENRI